MATRNGDRFGSLASEGEMHKECTRKRDSDFDAQENATALDFGQNGASNSGSSACTKNAQKPGETCEESTVCTTFPISEVVIWL